MNTYKYHTLSYELEIKLNTNVPALKELAVNKPGQHSQVSSVINKGLLAKKIQQSSPTDSEPSLEEQVGLSLVKRPGKNILDGKKDTWKG